MTDSSKNVWPDRLMIRDTQLHDDMGGAGQRIYTTAGQGYEKREYVRADVHGKWRRIEEWRDKVDPVTVIYAVRSPPGSNSQWHVGVMYRNVSGGWNDANIPFARQQPVYWMPLPSPPPTLPKQGD